MVYVVIGASASGINGAKTLRKLDKDAKIILISKDEHVYSRCILHHYISGKRNISELNFTDKDFFGKYDIDWIKGVEVIRLCDEERTIELSNNEKIKYDKLLIASGASSFIPPIENLRDANNVVGLRNLDDAQKIKDVIKSIENVVILGAGLIGIDATAGLVDYGLDITVVEMIDRILGMQLDHYAAGRYEKLFKEKGVNFKLGVKAEKLIVDENNNPEKLVLNTGEKIPCELVIVATGVRANVKFLKESNVKTDKLGLVFDAKGQTNVKEVFGAGDVSGKNPIWPTAVKEGIIAASNMVGKELIMTDFFGSKNTMNYLGLGTLSLGEVLKPDKTFIEETEKKGDNYKKIIHKDGKIYGAIIQGDLSYAGILTQLIKKKIDVSKVKKPLFKIDYSDFFNIKENLEFSY